MTESETIALAEIRALAATRVGDMIKGVVDLERGILLLDADSLRRSVDVLPAPFGPMSPTISPAPTVNEKSSTAFSAP